MSSQPTVFVTQPVHPDAMDVLQRSARVLTAFGPQGVALESVLGEIDAIVARFSGVPAPMIEGAPQLRVIARAGVGYENIAVDAATAKGVPVLITESANATSVAEHAFALLLAAARRLPAWDRRARAGEPDLIHAREGELSLELRDLTLGILGLGAIGTEIARIASAGFGMKVIAHHPRRTDDQVRAAGAEPVESFESLLRRSDVLTVQVPLNDQTRSMISDHELSLMKPGSILINIARGGVVDEAALYRSLTTGHLRAAGIDVWETKVPEPGNPLLSLDSVVVSPHRAGRTDAAQRRMGMRAVQAAIDVLEGRVPVDVRDVTGQIEARVTTG